MTDILKQLGAKSAIVFAFDEHGKLKLHLLSEEKDNVQLLKIIAIANEIVDRFTGLFNHPNIAPPKE